MKTSNVLKKMLAVCGLVVTGFMLGGCSDKPSASDVVSALERENKAQIDQFAAMGMPESMLNEMRSVKVKKCGIENVKPTQDELGYHAIINCTVTKGSETDVINEKVQLYKMDGKWMIKKT